jgi:hypothetical protein
MADAPKINFIDNPHAPEVHSTGHAGLWMHMGNVHITLGAGRIDHSSTPGPINHVIIGRVVIPAPAALELANQIKAMLENPLEGQPQAPSGGSLH